MNDGKIKLIKILQLARYGVGGEKDNARRILARELAKRGLRLSDLEDSEKKATLSATTWTYRDKDEEFILLQCIRSVVKKAALEISRYKGKRKILVHLSDLDHIELRWKFSYFKRFYKKEKSLFLMAFVIKHELYSGENKNTTDASTLTKQQLSDMRQISSFANGLSESRYQSTRKQLPSRKGEI